MSGSFYGICFGEKKVCTAATSLLHSGREFRDFLHFITSESVNGHSDVDFLFTLKCAQGVQPTLRQLVQNPMFPNFEDHAMGKMWTLVVAWASCVEGAYYK